MNQHRNALISNLFFNLLGGTSAMIGGLAKIITYILKFSIWVALIVILVMTPWDFLVWLLNAEWRTTHFQASIYSFFVALGTFAVFIPFELIRKWMELIERWCDNHTIKN